MKWAGLVTTFHFTQPAVRLTLHAGARFDLCGIAGRRLVQLPVGCPLGADVQCAPRGASEYWRKQQWLVGDPLVRLVPRKVPADHSRAMTHDEVTRLLAKDVPLREKGAVDDAV